MKNELWFSLVCKLSSIIPDTKKIRGTPKKPEFVQKSFLFWKPKSIKLIDAPFYDLFGIFIILLKIIFKKKKMKWFKTTKNRSVLTFTETKSVFFSFFSSKHRWSNKFLPIFGRGEMSCIYRYRMIMCFYFYFSTIVICAENV